MKIKTQDLIDSALDFVVAKLEGKNITLMRNDDGSLFPQPVWADGLWKQCYSSSWSQGGPIIERPQDKALMGIEGRVGWAPGAKEFGPFFRAWYGPSDDPYIVSYGPTPLIAAMRCYVASKLGDEVDVPDELMKT